MTSLTSLLLEVNVSGVHSKNVATMYVEAITIILALVLFILIHRNRRPNGFPPGPSVFPVVGNLPLLAGCGTGGIHPLLCKLGEKYGKMFSIQLGARWTVVINDYKLIKEAWNNPDLCGRPKMHVVAARTDGVPRGIMFQDSEEWTEQRRFTLRHLRDFGFGKKSMENLIGEEALELIQGFTIDAGKPISTQNRFNIAVLNALWYITAGERFHHDDPKLKEVVAAVTRNLTDTPSNKAVFFLPWLAKYFPRLSGWNKFKIDLAYTYNFLKDSSQNRLKTYEGNSPEHFTDVYIDEIRRTTNPESSFYKERGELTMIAVKQDIFVAGAETTSTTLTWLFLYMALFQEKQVKLHEEIDRVLNSKFPCFEDRSRMPYCEAVIMETLRYSSMVPLGLYHRSTKDLYFNNFYIPKDTILIPNLYAAHHDQKAWGDPENFRPERFLTEDGTDTIKHEAFIPFSFGKRICIGETLARNELFLFVTSIFQKFVVTTDPSAPRPTTAQNVTVISTPLPHKLILSKR